MSEHKPSNRESFGAQAAQLSDAVGERGAELGAKTQDTVGVVAQSATDAAVGIKDTTVEHGSKVKPGTCGCTSQGQVGFDGFCSACGPSKFTTGQDLNVHRTVAGENAAELPMQTAAYHPRLCSYAAYMLVILDRHTVLLKRSSWSTNGRHAQFVCCMPRRSVWTSRRAQAVEQLQPAQEPAKNAFTELFTGIKVRSLFMYVVHPRTTCSIYSEPERYCCRTPSAIVLNESPWCVHGRVMLHSYCPSIW